MLKKTSMVFLLLMLSFTIIEAQTVWLDELDLSTMTAGMSYFPRVNRSVRGYMLTIGGKKFSRGVGTNPVSWYLINLNGEGKRFVASVGLDDSVSAEGTAKFMVLGDRKILWESGLMKRGDKAKEINISLKGVKQLGLLVTEGGKYNCADWCEARIELKKNIPAKDLVPQKEYYILTPKPTGFPHINSPKVFGVRPGNPFFYTIAASGQKPVKLQTENLPEGLSLDLSTGRITGVVKKAGQYEVKLIAENSLGKAEQKLTIMAGETIALTPPMGWNSWNAFGKNVDQEKVHAAAEALVKSGLKDYGYSYVVVDGGWSVNPNGTDPRTSGEPYDKDGKINANPKFPDMKGLSDYIHSQGLLFGLHTSPGPGTCANWTACYGHERQCAERFAEWGVDYIKYDWCSYTEIAKDNSMPELQKPFLLMRGILNDIKRDIVFSINPGPAGRKADPWKWGKDVGANMWRTTGDINDTWQSVGRIGFSQNYGKYASPGHWNDPDMLVVGAQNLETVSHPTKLTADEQYTHISLWSLLASPLMLGCDMTKIDDFTMNLLTNTEVLAINQDPLGRQADCIYNKNGKQIWAKDMQDGSKAVGLFWVEQSTEKPADYFRWKDDKKTTKVTLDASQLGIQGKFKVRDVWRQKDLGTFQDKFTADVPYHGVVLLQVTGEKLVSEK